MSKYTIAIAFINKASAVQRAKINFVLIKLSYNVY